MRLLLTVVEIKSYDLAHGHHNHAAAAQPEPLLLLSNSDSDAVVLSTISTSSYAKVHI